MIKMSYSEFIHLPKNDHLEKEFGQCLFCNKDTSVLVDDNFYGALDVCYYSSDSSADSSGEDVVMVYPYRVCEMTYNYKNNLYTIFQLLSEIIIKDISILIMKTMIESSIKAPCILHELKYRRNYLGNFTSDYPYEFLSLNEIKQLMKERDISFEENLSIYDYIKILSKNIDNKRLEWLWDDIGL